MPIIKNKIMNMIVMNFAGFIGHTFAGLIQIGFNKTLPFSIRKCDSIQILQLCAQVGQHRFLRIQIRQKVITLVFKVTDKLPLQIRLALIALCGFPLSDIFIKDDKAI